MHLLDLIEGRSACLPVHEAISFVRVSYAFSFELTTSPLMRNSRERVASLSFGRSSSVTVVPPGVFCLPLSLPSTFEEMRRLESGV